MRSRKSKGRPRKDGAKKVKGPKPKRLRHLTARARTKRVHASPGTVILLQSKPGAKRESARLEVSVPFALNLNVRRLLAVLRLAVADLFSFQWQSGLDARGRKLPRIESAGGSRPWGVITGFLSSHYHVSAVSGSRFRSRVRVSVDAGRERAGVLIRADDLGIPLVASTGPVAELMQQYLEQFLLDHSPAGGPGIALWDDQGERSGLFYEFVAG